MVNFDTKHSNVQKLAQTLKRCGMATSVTDAHKIAGDITKTEKKVQSFFNERKKEIHTEFLKTVHPNRVDMVSHSKDHIGQTLIRQAAISQSNKQAPIKDENVKNLIERAKNPKPLNIQIEFETPSLNIGVSSISKRLTPEPVATLAKNEAVVFHKSSFSLDESSSDKQVSYLPLEDQDYISRFIKNEKEEIPAVEKEEMSETLVSEHAQKSKISDMSVHTPEVERKVVNVEVKQEIKLETPKTIDKSESKPELKVDLGNFFGVKKQESDELKPRIETSIQAAQSVPRSQAPAVDIHNFFNFAKKGKV